MKKLAAFYFSGTGNTKFVANGICERLSPVYQTEIFDITSTQNCEKSIINADLILIAFPIYGSAPPIPMRNFVHKYGKFLLGKKVAIAETQYFFSGDGAASIGRTVEKFGGEVLWAEHFNMPNNLSDCKAFPIKNGGEITKTLDRAQKKMDAFAQRILKDRKLRRGFGIVPHAIGYYCQRKFWRKHEAQKQERLSIDPSRCIGCGLCAKKCPVSNIAIENKKAIPAGKCVLCYRCVNLCPSKAIKLVGSNPPETQYTGPKR